jgi:hypothetical protein
VILCPSPASTSFDLFGWVDMDIISLDDTL